MGIMRLLARWKNTLTPGLMHDARPWIWNLIQRRLGIFAFCFVLVGVNRLAGLVAPGSIKFVVDDIVGKGRPELLEPLLVLMLAATVTQAGTALIISRILASASQGIIHDLRRLAQRHLVRLPLSFFDK